MKGKVTMRDLLNSGKRFVGTYMTMPSLDLLEIIAYAGMDYVIFDNEHPCISQYDLKNLIRVADGLGIASMVRISGPSEAEIKHALDAGACAISVPNILTLDDAKDVVKYARFYPMGQRGLCESVRANQYSMAYSDMEFCRVSNEDIVILAALESPETLEKMEEFVKIPGIDVYAVGFCDLCCRLGIPGDYENPKVVNAIDDIHRVAHENGKYAVITTGDVEKGKQCMNGVYQTDYLCFGMDAAIISAAYKNLVRELKGQVQA